MSIKVCINDNIEIEVSGFSSLYIRLGSFELFSALRDPTFAAPKRFFSMHQGWSADDTEIHIGPYDICISRKGRTTAAAA